MFKITIDHQTPHDIIVNVMEPKSAVHNGMVDQGIIELILLFSMR
jgi:hypothetical protein